MSARIKLPNRREQETRAWEYRDTEYQVSIAFDDTGQIKEVFVKGALHGSDMDSLWDDICILISLGLQCGMTPDELRKSLLRLPTGGPFERATKPASIVGGLLDLIAEIEAEQASETAA